MTVKIKSGRAVGTVKAPPSKSMAHRLLICAAMADGQSVVRGISDCEDVAATLDCIKAMGIKWERCGDDVTVYGRPFAKAEPEDTLYPRESGSTLRFLIPSALLCGKTVMFRGAPGLMSRPMGVYADLCREHGLTYLCDGASITVKGPLKSGTYSVVGNISSQFISGLLFALPQLKGDSRIKIAPPIESRSYINMTLDALKKFGVNARWEDDHTLYIKGGQAFAPTEVTVEGDYSGAAFTEALNLLGSSVEITGLDPDSIQGDKVYRKYYSQLYSGVPTIHIGDCPDLGPILFAIAAARCGGVFTGTARLKIKESDRARAMAEELKKFGASVSVAEDRVTVYPACFHAPTEPLCGHNDHRIVMSLAVLLTATGGSIEGAEAVSKSYPAFFKDLQYLGIEVEYDQRAL